MMIPFMGIQSMVMAKQFGENFQYGKRRISAMSNEDFNKLTPAKLLSNANDELKSQIPLMKESMADMRQFQEFIVKEFLLTIRSIIDAGLGKLIGLTPTEINQTVQNIEHFLHGHFEGHGDEFIGPPTEPPTETPVTPTPPQPPKIAIDFTITADEIRKLPFAKVEGVTRPAVNQHFHPGELSFLDTALLKKVFILLNSPSNNAYKQIYLLLSQQYATAKFRLSKGINIQGMQQLINQVITFLLKMNKWLGYT